MRSFLTEYHYFVMLDQKFLNQMKRESLHPDESQNCKNQSCSSNYMPSNAASKSLFI